MSPAFLAFFLALFAIPEADLAGLQSSGLVIERVTGPPPAKSQYLSEDSGVKVRRLERKSKPGLFIFLNVTKKFPEPAKVSIRLYARSNNAYKAVMMDYQETFCYYRFRENRPILKTLKEVLKLPKDCPVKPAIFKVDNWNLSEMMPETLPIRDGYKLQTILNFENQDNVEFNVFLRPGRRH